MLPENLRTQAPVKEYEFLIKEYKIQKLLYNKRQGIDEWQSK